MRNVKRIVGFLFVLLPFVAQAGNLRVEGKAATQMAKLLKFAALDKSNVYEERLSENTYIVSLKNTSMQVQCYFGVQFDGGKPSVLVDDRAVCTGAGEDMTFEIGNYTEK